MILPHAMRLARQEETSGFPPSSGQVIEAAKRISQQTHPRTDMGSSLSPTWYRGMKRFSAVRKELPATAH